MKKNIILVLLIVLGIVYYLNYDKKELTVSELQDISNQYLNETQLPTRPTRSWWQVIKRSYQDKHRPDDGITRIGSSEPDSDRSACGNKRTDKEKIITYFAGYVLEYPCTTGKKGGYQLEFSNDKLLSQRYTLYLGAVLGQKNDSIWWNGVYDDNTKSFRIELTNNGKRVNFKHDLENDSSFEKIMDIDAKNLIVYYKKNGNSSHVIGLLKNQLDANNYNPIVSCYPGLLSPYKLFNPLNDTGVKLNCNAYWSLTKDIKVRIVHFDSKFAYHFNEIYQVVNKKLNEMIVTQPNQSLKPTEK